MNMTTQTIDKLFLELSQFTQATTEKELDLAEHLAIYVHAHKTGNLVPPHIEAKAQSLIKRYRCWSGRP